MAVLGWAAVVVVRNLTPDAAGAEPAAGAGSASTGPSVRKSLALFWEAAIVSSVHLLPAALHRPQEGF